MIRSVYYKYTHPKEAQISNGVLNRGIDAAAGKVQQTSATAGAAANVPAISDSAPKPNLAFVYPYGASLSIQKPAFPVLSSGPLSLPLNRPVCAMWGAGMLGAGKGAGRLCVLGSSYVFHDEWVSVPRRKS